MKTLRDLLEHEIRDLYNAQTQLQAVRPGLVERVTDETLRNGIKTFSDWPTIPQLYIDGEFVGGSDICMELYQSGELAKKVEDHPKVDAE